MRYLCEYAAADCTFAEGGRMYLVSGGNPGVLLFDVTIAQVLVVYICQNPR